MDVDLVLLAMGFTGPVKGGMLEQLGVDAGRARQRRHRCQLHDQSSRASSRPAIMRRGQSLVVWAIAEGRKAAAGIDRYLHE